MDIRISERAPSPTAVVAGPFDLSRFMPSLDAVYAFLAGRPDIEQTGHNIALYDRGQRMEVGVEVAGPFESDGPVIASELPGGHVAHATHTTGYESLSMTYNAIADWCADHDLHPVGVQWEVYGDPDGDDHVDVEICFLLA